MESRKINKKVKDSFLVEDFREHPIAYILAIAFFVISIFFAVKGSPEYWDYIKIKDYDIFDSRSEVSDFEYKYGVYTKEKKMEQIESNMKELLKSYQKNPETKPFLFGECGTYAYKLLPEIKDEGSRVHYTQQKFLIILNV